VFEEGQLAGFWCQQGDSCVNQELLVWRIGWCLFWVVAEVLMVACA